MVSPSGCPVGEPAVAARHDPRGPTEPSSRTDHVDAATHAGRSAEPAVEKLIERAFDKDPLVRRAALRGIRLIGESGAVPGPERAQTRSQPVNICLQL